MKNKIQETTSLLLQGKIKKAEADKILLDLHNVSKRFTEENMIEAAKYAYEYRDTTQFPHFGFETNCLNNFKQWLTKFW